MRVVRIFFPGEAFPTLARGDAQVLDPREPFQANSCFDSSWLPERIGGLLSLAAPPGSARGVAFWRSDILIVAQVERSQVQH